MTKQFHFVEEEPEVNRIIDTGGSLFFMNEVCIDCIENCKQTSHITIVQCPNRREGNADNEK